MESNKITTCISTNNNLNYLKLAIKSVRQNAYYKDMPIIVHAENCNDGTDIWLKENMYEYNLDVYIDHNNQPKGIGGGMNFCVDKVQTEFVNIIHSDMWIAPNQDLELLKLFENESKPLIVSSFRVQPKIFPNDPDYRPGTVFVPMNAFGEYHHNFNNHYFDEWATEFSIENDVIVRKGGGAGFFCRKRDYVHIGGNDPIFSPASWEDMDLFIRMQNEGYEFKMTSKSVVYHFSARGSHFKDDDITKKSQRQIESEQNNVRKFMTKWGTLPQHDSETFVKPIHNQNVENIMNFEKNLVYFK
jgi:GT2 family glycosyltransferase